VDYKETSDLTFAAYLMMEGIEIRKAEEIRQSAGGNYRYNFVFLCDDERWDQLAFRFANSDIPRYDAALRTLKKLCKSRAQRPADLTARRIG
jgi:hypothetical protein